MRAPLALFALSLAVHLGWAAIAGPPADWDAQYYGSVARAIARGDGATTGALWNLLYVPDALPMPADGYWSPLPSRVLVPFVALWPAWGDRVGAAVLAACWAPLAHALARALGADERAAIGAGALAACAGPYAGLASTPDSIALYGAIGGMAWLAVGDRSAVPTVALALFAALARNDGFVLGLALAFGRLAVAGGGGGARAIALAGVGGTLLWSARNVLVFGPAWVEARARVADGVDYVALVRGDPEPLGLAARLVAALAMLPGAALALGALGLFVLVPFVAVAAHAHRATPAVRAGLAYAVLMPVVLGHAAPAAAAHGAVWRSGAALFPLVCALAATGLADVGRRTAAARGYPEGFVPVVVALGFAVGSVGVGRTSIRTDGDDGGCAALAAASVPADAVVFAPDPLLLEARCGRRSVVLVRGLAPERAAELAQRFAIRHVVIAAAATEGSVAPEELTTLLPGWSPCGARVWCGPARPPEP